MVDISWLTLAIFGLRRPWPAQPYLGPDPVSGSCAQVVVALPAVVEEVAVAAATSSSSSRGGSSSWCWPATASGSPHPHLASTCQSRAASPLLSPIQPHIHPGKLDLSLISKQNCPPVGNSDIHHIDFGKPDLCSCSYSFWKTQFVFDVQSVWQQIQITMHKPPSVQNWPKLDPVGSAVRYEVIKLCTGSV